MASFKNRIATIVRDEQGSILPLIIGYATVALALIVVTVGATSLHLTQKRIDAVADASALAAADGFTLTVEGGSASARLDNAELFRLASLVVGASGGDVALEAAYTDDGVTARVEVSTVWRPPLISALLPEGFTLTASGSSRTALDDD